MRLLLLISCTDLYPDACETLRPGIRLVSIDGLINEAMMRVLTVVVLCCYSLGQKLPLKTRRNESKITLGNNGDKMGGVP